LSAPWLGIETISEYVESSDMLEQLRLIEVTWFPLNWH